MRRRMMGAKEIMPKKSTDQNTLLLWHFDYQKKVSLDSSYWQQSTSDNSYKGKILGISKFGKGSFVDVWNGPSISAYINNGNDGDGWTIEWWMKTGYSASSSFIDFADYYMNVYRDSITMMKVNSSGQYTYNIPYGEWVHVAVSQSSDSLYMYVYINGIKQSAVFAGAYSPINDISLYSKTNGLYIDELRLSKVIRYYSNFTPPSQPFN